MKWFWSMTMQNNTVNSHYYRNPRGGGRFSGRNSGGTWEKLIDLSLNIWNNMKLKKDKVSKVASLTIKRSGRTQFKNGSFTFFYRNVDFCYVSQDRGRSIWVSTIARKKKSNVALREGHEIVHINHQTKQNETSARVPTVTNNQTEHVQHSARDTNVTNNPTEHRENGARDTNVTKNHTEQIQNSARETNITNSQLNTYKTLRQTPA